MSIRSWLCAALLAVALAACGADAPGPAGTGRLVVMKSLPDGPIYVEGSLTQLRVVGTDGATVVDGMRPMRTLEHPLYEASVPAGRYVLMSVEHPCVAHCPVLDPPDDKTRCELRFEVKPNTTTQVTIVITSDGHRRIEATCTTDTLSKAQYQQALLRILERSGGLSNAYGDLVVRKRPRAECARMMLRFLRDVTTLVDRVSVLRPPADAAPVQRRFLVAAHESIGRMIDINDAVARGETSCGRELNARLYGMPSTRRAEAAMGELEKLGYHLGLQ